MSTTTEVTTSLTGKIASILAADKGTFSIGGSIPIVHSLETSTTTDDTPPPIERITSSPVTLRWDPASSPVGESRNVMFPPTSSHGVEQVSALLRDCQPASFGRGGEDVFDETYRKASKLDTSQFSSDFCPYKLGIVDTIAELLMPSTYMAGGSRGVKAELYKLNVYSAPSGHFKPHVDTPRSEQQFGSLVVCLPTVHTGGALEVRHAGQTVTYDWGAGTGLNDSDVGPAQLQWAAFYSDCEHEVLEVTNGHRVTLTYNLYCVLERIGVEGKIETMDVARLPLYSVVRDALANPLFMPSGGRLGFFCCHTYPHSSKSPADAPLFPSVLKGVDLCLFSVFKKLGLDVHVRRVLRSEIESIYGTREADCVKETMARPYVSKHSEGLTITERGGEDDSTQHQIWSVFGKRSRVLWLNSAMGKPKQMSFVHLTYGNQAGVNVMYTYAVLIVNLHPKGGDENKA
ncbi:hypothetical protein F5884DRAFT_798665 [Xylogone sp. PMI_703]|nr:hypothetical protein F5884DRAFT_798665 [Xylogone sp. PMI_703]